MAKYMSEIFDTTTIITIVAAVFILMRLRSVLGKRTGHQKPPFEPFEIDRKTREAKPKNQKTLAHNESNNADNVISLPDKDGPKKKSTRSLTPAEIAVNEYAKPGTKLNKQLKQIAEVDTGFNPNQFIDGAKMAYELIVSSFADGDKKTLKNLLSKEVFAGFSAAISQRESNGETVQSSFVGIEKCQIKQAEIIGKEAHLTVEFISQIISSTINANGDVISGDPEQVDEVKDIWTFAKDIRSKDPNWKLVATESED